MIAICGSCHYFYCSSQNEMYVRGCAHQVCDAGLACTLGIHLAVTKIAFFMASITSLHQMYTMESSRDVTVDSLLG